MTTSLRLALWAVAASLALAGCASDGDSDPDPPDPPAAVEAPEQPALSYPQIVDAGVSVLSVVGHVDPRADTLTIGGEPITIAEDGMFEAEVPINDGANAIPVRVAFDDDTLADQKDLIVVSVGGEEPAA
ncbi:MAG TPA: hypothetical protein VK631_02795, partial [Solirubrobacteraceae bacterium]|nr:hypothetical protein [Solirubrobacteraceae bacterium]